MKKSLIVMSIALAAVLAVAMVAGCGSSTTTPTTTPKKPTSSVKTYTQATKNITAKVGESFIIQLASNPTTGYQWQLTGPLSPAVVKVSNVYVPSKASSATVGSGGIEKWTFKGAATGDALIQLEYLQAGSNTNGGTAVFNVTVK